MLAERDEKDALPDLGGRRPGVPSCREPADEERACEQHGRRREHKDTTRAPTPQLGCYCGPDFMAVAVAAVGTGSALTSSRSASSSASSSRQRGHIAKCCSRNLRLRRRRSGKERAPLRRDVSWRYPGYLRERDAKFPHRAKNSLFRRANGNVERGADLDE